jgi:hypothetical protein
LTAVDAGFVVVGGEDDDGVSEAVGASPRGFPQPERMMPMLARLKMAIDDNTVRDISGSPRKDETPLADDDGVGAVSQDTRNR